MSAPTTNAALPTGQTLASILGSRDLAKNFVDAGIKRYRLSSDYLTPFHDKWTRYYKLYRQVIDREDDSDEPNTAVSYAFGVIEDLVSKNVEPLLKLRPPCSVRPRDAKDDMAAENFAGVASTFYATPKWQEDFTISERERHITGNAWERDCYYQEYDEGRRWAKVQSTVMTAVRSITGRLLGHQPTPYDDVQEVPARVPIRVGYGTEFPSVFRVFPEPNVTDVKRMHWLIEEVPAVGLADLKRVMTPGPDGQPQPFFNFDELERDRPGANGQTQPIAAMSPRTSAEDEIRQAVGEQPRNGKQSFQDDIDRVNLLWVWEQRRVWVIAQGKYLVAYMEDVFQMPRIPYRLRRYTPQPMQLYAVGAIEPIENDLYELRDIHTLSMRNWMRLVNRMVVYNEDAVPYPDDFQPRAGGRIRLRKPLGSTGVGQEIAALPTEDVTQTMITQESNTKGGIEKTVAAADFSPGAMGTQQTHKTAHGLEMISQSLGMRQETTRRMLQLNFQDQMFMMNKLYDQFLFDKTPFTIYGPDGTTTVKKFDRWDLDTEGRGFEYIFDSDPTFGDSAIQRNQLMVLLDVSLKYTQQSKAMGLKVKEIDFDDIIRRLLRSFGWSDTSQIMRDPAGPGPDQELQSMISGVPVAPSPKENLLDHLMNHMVQRYQLQPLVAQGKVDPKVLVMLNAHIQATMALVGQIMKDPEKAAVAILQPPGLLAPGMGGGGAAPAGPIDGQGGAMAPVTPPLPSTTGMPQNRQSAQMQ